MTPRAGRPDEEPGRRTARVAAARVPAAGGADVAAAIPQALHRLATDMGWAGPGGAFGAVIPDGARVVVKPNWVMHENQGPWGVDPLYTSPSLVRAVVDEALRSRAAGVILGDAPVQGCDFERLTRETGLDRWGATLAAADARFAGPRDFRRTRSRYVDGVRHASEDQLPMDEFVLFDLGPDSLLEPVSDAEGSFRVTQYDPARMRDAHAPGRHRFLVARAIMDADVVINLPKLKTHKKAGITGALKNLIGINGNKEFLPHHRVGGSADGGDCYPGRSPVKRGLEYALDRINGAPGRIVQQAWQASKRVLDWATADDPLGVEGSWHGNDTIWRTCLDLNRILRYGRSDGTMSDHPQRQVLTIVDAMIAGQGDGPLDVEPLPLGLLLAGEDGAAVDLVGAELLGYDYSRIPTVREAFGAFPWPVSGTTPELVTLAGELGDGPALELLSSMARPSVRHPMGWQAAARDVVLQTAG